MRNPFSRHTRAALLCAALALAGAPDLPAQTPSDSSALSRRIGAVLDTGELARVHWGISVREVTTGRVLYERNAKRRFVPASNLKLVVAATAVHHLEPGYRYRTSLRAAGEIRDGVLRGDLVVYGRGDPTISGRYQPSMTALFVAVADSLRARGVRRIDGAVVADVSHWPHEPLHGDWERYDLNWWYAAPTGPLGFNDNAIDFRVAPGAPGSPAAISWEPETRAFTFRNRTRTVSADEQQTLDFDRVPGTDTIFAYGRIPAGTPARTENFAVRDPAAYAATVLAETLRRSGIEVAGARVRVSLEAVPARELFALESGTLPQVLGPILQSSQNWYAEQLLKTVGHEVKGEGTWRAGLEAEHEFLTRVVGLDSVEFRLRDASGLSGGNLMTPSALVDLLRYIDRAQRMTFDALPVSAAPTGSLRRRFEDLPGRVRAKTGYIRNTDALSGFVTAADGERYAFSIIANGTGLPSARVRRAIDQVVRLIAGAR